MLDGESTRSVSLPEGDWIYLFDGTAYAGDSVVEMVVDLSEYPVFVRASSSLVDLVGWE